MATSSYPKPIIYSVGEGSSDPNLNKEMDERIRGLLEKFKDTQTIIYVNLEKVLLDSHNMRKDRSRSKIRCRSRTRSRSRDHSRSRSRSRSRGHSRSRSRSRSRSHSKQRTHKPHHGHHSRGHRSPMHFLHRRRHHPFHHHHRGPHFPLDYFSSEETGCESYQEENRAVDFSCRNQGNRWQGRWRRRHSMSGLEARCRMECPKQTDKVQITESEDQEVITINEDEPMESVGPEGNLEVPVDDSNPSKAL